jgi:ABC-2 type transport system ATP-binding protein
VAVAGTGGDSKEAGVALVVVDRIAKSFSTTEAVKDVSFSVEAGEIFGLLGPNGAGKTTTIRMMLDILKPDRGTIAIMGGPLTREKKNRLGYLPEERGLYRNLKVLDCMVYLAWLMGLGRAAARRRAQSYLERVDLAAHQGKKISELSKGMQQKVQFGTTILHDPEIIIVDEPFSGFDPVNTRLIKDLVFDMRAKGCSILMSTHQMHLVEEMCDHLVMFNRGEIVLRGAVREVRRRFAPNAVLVEGQGAWDTIPGVVEVLDKDGAKQLMLDDGVTPQQIFRALSSRNDLSVERFEVAIPSLDEIFVRVVGGELPAEARHV